jgi:CheY-like chemotaxis protein
MNQQTILLVVNDPVERKTLSGMLSSAGYEVLLAEDGALAIGTARRHRPDLIFIDILFQTDVAYGGGLRWDGLLILNWLRRFQETKDTPVIFICRSKPESYESKALAAGHVAFLRKPIHSTDLIALVQKTLRSPKPNRQPRKRVLFVEDEADWRLIAGACLEETGYEVVTAGDADEAIKRIDDSAFDGVILDLNLAGQSSLPLVQFINSNQPKAPILIYTGLEHDRSAIQGMMKLGATRYLRKGSMAELCQTLSKMLN